MELVHQTLRKGDNAKAETYLYEILGVTKLHETFLALLKGLRFYQCPTAFINIQTRVVHIDPGFFQRHITNSQDLLFLLYHERNHFLYQLFGTIDHVFEAVVNVRTRAINEGIKGVKARSIRVDKLLRNLEGPEATRLMIPHWLLNILEDAYTNAEIQLFCRSDFPSRVLKKESEAAGKNPIPLDYLTTAKFRVTFDWLREQVNKKTQKRKTKLWWASPVMNMITECANTLTNLHYLAKNPEWMMDSSHQFETLSANRWIAKMITIFIYLGRHKRSKSPCTGKPIGKPKHSDQGTPTQAQGMKGTASGSRISMKGLRGGGMRGMYDATVVEKVSIPTFDMRDLAHVDLLSDFELASVFNDQQSRSMVNTLSNLTSNLGVVSEMGSAFQRRLLIEDPSGEMLMESSTPRPGMTGASLVRFVSGRGGTLYTKAEERAPTLFLYLDVSASMSWVYPYVNTLLAEMSFLNPVTYTFSTVILGPSLAPMSYIMTTNGTNFDIVVKHMESHRPDFVIVVTDLEATIQDKRFLFLKEQYSNKLVVLRCHRSKAEVDEYNKDEEGRKPNFHDIPSAVGRHLILQKD